jgi:hypothetical protein
MPEYRAYTIEPDGSIRERFDLPSTNEATAREQAMRLVNGIDVELWQGEKRLAIFAHKSDQ